MSLDWLTNFPPQSPDLNPTEHLWRHLKTEEAKHSVKSWESLWKSHVGFNVNDKIVHKLVESIPARVHAAIKAKGWHINTKIFCSSLKLLGVITMQQHKIKALGLAQTYGVHSSLSMQKIIIMISGLRLFDPTVYLALY